MKLSNKDKKQIKQYLKIVSAVDAVTLQRSKLPFPVAEIILDKSSRLTSKEQDKLIDEVLNYNKKLLDQFKIKHRLPNGLLYEASQLYFRIKVKSALKHLIKITSEFWDLMEKNLGREYSLKLGIRGKCIEKIIEILEDEKYRVQKVGV